VSPPTASIIVDGHAHLHPCFPIGTFFEWAASNAASHSPGAGRSGAAPVCIVLTEGRREEAFANLHSSASSTVDGVCIEHTQEASSLAVSTPKGARLFVIAGTQVVCDRKIEVLAIGARLRQLDGRPLKAVLGAVRAADAIPVLPWGFGKWLGARGALVREAIRAAAPGTLFLGDNGGRWAGLGMPREFSLAERGGIAVLPGSDPLPLLKEVRRPCSYGFALEGGFDADFPARSLVQLVRDLAHSPGVVGERVNFRTFARNQAELRWQRWEERG